MRLLFLILAGCFLIAAEQGCVSKGSPIAGLGTPRFVAQSSPDSVVQTGIRQDPNTGRILLQWYTVSGAAGYKIYRSDTADQTGKPLMFAPIGNVLSSPGSNDTSMVDPTLTQKGIEYFYYFTAYAPDGTAGAPSDTINYELLPRPTTSLPAANDSVDANNLQFAWQDNTGGGYTVIRVEDLSEGSSAAVWITKKFQVFGTYLTKAFDFDNTATSSLIAGHSYQWRVERFNPDKTGRPYEGSTSPWSQFTIK